jgi:ABC-2 type transport system ATP-binding protein
VLVTHFMEEAERLCDRIMVINRGRVVALDSPSGLIAEIGTEQRLTFRPSEPIDNEVFANLPEVTTIHRNGPQVVITGTSNVVQAVTALLAGLGVVAEELRVEQTSLEDAYLEITSGTRDSDESEPEAN